MTNFKYFFVQISECRFVYKWIVLLHFKSHFVFLVANRHWRSIGTRKFLFKFIFKAIMAESLKLFKRLEKILESMAVPSSGQIPKSTIIWKRTFFFLSMILYIIASLAYFVFEAKLVSEYCDSFYLFTTESTTTLYLFTYIRKMPRIAAFIDKLNDFFLES